MRTSYDRAQPLQIILQVTIDSSETQDEMHEKG